LNNRHHLMDENLPQQASNSFMQAIYAIGFHSHNFPLKFSSNVFPFIYFSSSHMHDYRSMWADGGKREGRQKKTVANPICMDSHLFISAYLLLDEIRKCTFNILYRLSIIMHFMVEIENNVCVRALAFVRRRRRKLLASIKAKLELDFGYWWSFFNWIWFIYRKQKLFWPLDLTFCYPFLFSPFFSKLSITINTVFCFLFVCLLSKKSFIKLHLF